MAGLSVKIPVINEAFYIKPNDITQVQSALSNISTKYGSIIANVSSATFVPADVIKSVIFIESRGDENVKTTGVEAATGLMQVSPATAYDTIKKEIEKKRLSAPERAMLNKYLNLGAFPKTYDSNIKAQLAKNLKKPEFNILIGSMYLGILMELNTEKGKVRFDKVIVQYNAGFYFPLQIKETWKKDEQSLYKSLNPVTKAYVLKFIGKNGTLDILV